ncbi:MAG: hypothetical protein ABSE73_01750 [Planctomycetota bacterium]
MRNQLQNASFEEDWLVSSVLARRRWGLIARAEVGYGESDGKIDHWEAPAEWRDAGTAHSGRYSVKLIAGRKLSQSVRVAMRSPAGGNPASQQTDFQPLEPGDLAKLDRRVVKGGAWIKAAALPEGKAKISIAGGGKAETLIPGGTYDWRWVWVSSAEPWAAASQMTITIECAAGTMWVGDAVLAELPLGANLAVNGGFEKLDANGWPEGYSQPEAFWWYRFDYYSFTGWGHDGGYGCHLPQRIDLVPGYRWRGHAAVDSLVSHSGRNSLRMVAYPGDQFGVLGPPVELAGDKPFEIAAWVRADRIHQVELMAVNADTNEYVLMDSDHFAGLEAVGVAAGSKGQGTYDWTYLRKLICPKSAVKRIRPLLAVRGFDGRIIEKNIVGTVWFDDVEIIQRGGTEPTPSSPLTAIHEVEADLFDLDLGERLWGKNVARAALLWGNADVRLFITSPTGKTQEVRAKVGWGDNTPAFELPYRIDELCSAWDQQYTVQLSITSGGVTRTLDTAFGTPSSLLTSRASHQFLFPEEELVVAANLQVSRQSLEELSKVVLQVVAPGGKVVSEMVVDKPAAKLPIIVPAAKALSDLNTDRCITFVPDLKNCAIHPWREAVRDYTVVLRLAGSDGKELARAAGVQFGRITHFDPSELKMIEKAPAKGGQPARFEPAEPVTVNAQHFLLAGGKPFFPVYFGEYGDTFRPQEGINITRDQIGSLGANPLLLSDDERKKYGMDKLFGCGEWDLNGMLNQKPADIAAKIDKLRADNPGKPIVSGYDLISHPGSRRADVARYFFPAYDVAGMEVSFGAYVPNLRVDYVPAMQGKNCAILVGFEHYYFLSFEQLRYRSYLAVMRGAAGLGLIPSRMMEGRPECNNYLRGMNAECRALAPVFAAPPPKLLTQASVPNLFTWERELEGKRYLFVVRGEPFLTRGLFQWPGRETPGGKRAHTEPPDKLLAQHWAENTRVFDVSAGDTIVQEVFIEGAAPRMLALQFRSRRDVDHTWEHRAYWGAADLARFTTEATYPADQKPPAPWRAWMVVENPPQPINSSAERGAFYFEVLGGPACKAVDGQPSLKRLGAVPQPGQWLTLRVPAKDVGLEGEHIDGIAFAVDGGQVFWGKTSLASEAGKETVVLDGSFETLATDTGTWPVRFTVPGAKSVRVRALFENVELSTQGNSWQDTFPVPYRARVYESEAKNTD